MITIKKIFDESPYDFEVLPSYFEEKDLQRGLAKVLKASNTICKDWNNKRNTEWVIRPYIAGKLIMSASIMLGTKTFSEENNALISVPYLSYYALLSCMRAVLLTDPKQEWENGKIITLTHTKIRNIVSDIIAQYNVTEGKDFKKKIDEYRTHRELFSYDFPSSGLKLIRLKNDVEDDCRLLVEIAQCQSQILEMQGEKVIHGNYNFDEDEFKKSYIYRNNYIDCEDFYRARQLIKDKISPRSIQFTIREGLVDDFFGSWYSETETGFNPDDHTRIIFDFL